ncbi:uncharacterized protein hhla2b.1 isoform X3 [Siphateles boraxobius]|uniref:uncharacterized protein hhla2b.1 isoform X3 n=1 Tax=Siphateles boraxobius TaxID=180520 RepID=UPI004062C7ED
MIYCLYTDDEECIHLVFPLVQALKKRAMAAAHSWTCLILVWIIADTTGKTPDIQVTCMFSEDCVLPCVFEAVGDEIIYWFRQNVLIHSYKQGSSLLDQPDQHYNNKTSLFTEVISSGNASVHIKKSSPQDRGKYRCLVTSSRKTSEHFIIVKVEEPAVLPDALHSFTRKTADKQDLYSVESKIRKLEDLTYICLVQSFYKSQTWRTSLQEKEISSFEGQDFNISCVAPWNLQNFTLTWSYTKGHESSTVYTYDSLTQLSSSVWKERVRLVTPRGQGGDGSLQLLVPLRLEHAGLYTCILSALRTKHEVRTRVNIIPSTAIRQAESSTQWWIPATVITALAVSAVAAIVTIKCKDGCSKSSQPHEEAEMQPIRVTDANSGAPSEDTCLTEEIANRTA